MSQQLATYVNWLLTSPQGASQVGQFLFVTASRGKRISPDGVFRYHCKLPFDVAVGRERETKYHQRNASMFRALSCVLSLGSFLFAGENRADKGVDLKPALAKPGTLLIDESFSGQELGKAWTVAKGEWTVKDGAVVGREKSEDMHAAVAMLSHPHRDSILRFSFKIGGAKGVSLSLNHAKGHLFRIAISEAGLSLIKDKDKKDPNSKPKVLAKAGSKLDPAQWHTMLVEIHGDKVTVQTDHSHKLGVQDPAFAVEKTGFRFVARGESLLLDDIKVWQVQP